MCGRYNFDSDDDNLFDILNALNGQVFHTGEIFPTNSAPVLVWRQKRCDYQCAGRNGVGEKNVSKSGDRAAVCYSQLGLLRVEARQNQTKVLVHPAGEKRFIYGGNFW